MLCKLVALFRTLQAKGGLCQFGIFLAVGVLNTAFGYGCFVVFLRLQLHYALAALFSTILGVLFNFRTIGWIVFRNRDNGLLLRFIGVYAAIYGINLLGLRLLIGIGVGPVLGGAVLLLPSALLAYFLQKRFVFANGVGRPGREEKHGQDGFHRT